MPRQNTASVTRLDVLQLLSAQRRQEIIGEALGGRARAIFADHRQATIGELVEILTGDASWSMLRQLGVSAVLQPQATAPWHNGGGAPPVRKNGRGRPSTMTQDLLDQIMRVIVATPGLRNEQIQRSSGLPPKVVKAGLAKLRETKRVKTTGLKRAMTYAV
jgi:hypothetical protein